MLAGTALYVRLLVYAGLSLFIISGLYIYMVVCVVYAYNLTSSELHSVKITGKFSFLKKKNLQKLFFMAEHQK